MVFDSGSPRLIFLWEGNAVRQREFWLFSNSFGEGFRLVVVLARSSALRMLRFGDEFLRSRNCSCNCSGDCCLYDCVDFGSGELPFGGVLLDSIGVSGRVPFSVDLLVQPVESLLLLGTLDLALTLSGSVPWHRTCRGNEDRGVVTGG
jgi:hypothetical protein